MKNVIDLISMKTQLIQNLFIKSNFNRHEI
jgi:hypothetical protein